MHLTDRWYRVFFAKGDGIAVLGDAELARVLARRTPRAIHHEIAVIYRCQSCGVEGPWTASWCHYFELAQHPAHVRAKAIDGQYIACSEDCFGDLVERSFRSPHFVRWHDEPRQGERAGALWRAQSDERRRRLDAVEYRKVPMPEWRGQGFCKWCNGPMTAADRPRTMWHARCARQWELHARADAQMRYLRQRDGRECATPGCTNVGYEVDHRRPLWSIRHLPAMIRRAFYGPMNLWLLCRSCHAAKTKREAADRATLRAAGRLDDDQAPMGRDISGNAGVATPEISSKT